MAVFANRKAGNKDVLNDIYSIEADIINANIDLSIKDGDNIATIIKLGGTIIAEWRSGAPNFIIIERINYLLTILRERK